MSLCCVRERRREWDRERTLMSISEMTSPGDSMTNQQKAHSHSRCLVGSPSLPSSGAPRYFCSSTPLHDHVISGPRWARRGVRDDSHGRLSTFSTPVNGLLLTLKDSCITGDITASGVCTFIAEREKIKSFSTFTLQASGWSEIHFSQILKWIKEPINKQLDETRGFCTHFNICRNGWMNSTLEQMNECSTS